MKNSNGWIVSAFVGACCLAQAFMLGSVVAAPTLGHSKVEPLSATVPRPPSSELMAKFFGFPPSVKLKMKRVVSSLGYEKSRPILAVTYANEKQTPCLISFEIHKAGSLRGPEGAEYEQTLKRMIKLDRGYRQEEAQEWLIKRGMIPIWAQPGENPQGVEVRPGGRMVFCHPLDWTPEKSTKVTFTTVGKYDVALILVNNTPDQYEYDPEESDSEEKKPTSHSLIPTKTMYEAFAQMERVMPFFSHVDVPTPQEAARARQLAREAIIRAAPAPKAPTGQEFEKCLGFARPVHLEASKSAEGFLFNELKPIWVMSYYAEGFGSQYEVELYPARSLFGEHREWFEGWLEHPVPYVRTTRDGMAPKIASNPDKNAATNPAIEALRVQQHQQFLAQEQKRLAEEERLRSPDFTRVETRPDGRKVYFHIFDFMGKEKAPVAFSTIGNYDLVLMQIPNAYNAPGVKVVPNGIEHRDVLQAFAELEVLIGH